MQLGPPTLAGLQHICRNLRARDRLELEAVTWEKDDLERAQRWYAMWQSDALFGQVAAINGEPVAVLMLAWVSPRAAMAGMLATNRWPEIAAPFARHCLRNVKPIVVGLGCRRVETRIWADHTDARRFLEFFGARVEVPLERFGRNGETFLQYAWTDLEVRHVHDRRLEGLEATALRH